MIYCQEKFLDSLKISLSASGERTNFDYMCEKRPARIGVYALNEELYDVDMGEMRMRAKDAIERYCVTCPYFSGE